MVWGLRVQGLLLGGSWVVTSGVISRLIWVITIVTLLITPLMTTHEPPSTVITNRWIPNGFSGPPVGCLLSNFSFSASSIGLGFRVPRFLGLGFKA